ncbi:MAG: class I SAM-dependent methyltransferase [Nitrospirae bacterium]|nr:class I SAM-dependent methyltransferase [Nitrospirota bacterium]
MRDVVKAFDQYAEDYDRWFDSEEGSALFGMEIALVRTLMKDLEHPFLEIGVGSGRFAKELGIDFGIDFSSRLLEIAKSRGIKVKMARGEKLPFTDESFGGVFILFTLCFVDNPEMVISESKRVLKKGGGLVVGIINRKSLWGELYIKKKEEGHPIYRHARLYSIDEVIKMVEKEDMEIERYSSTLCQPPSENPYKEPVHHQIIEGAGFVCIFAKKP